MQWIINNKEWIFSGIGAVIVAAIIQYFWTKSKNKKVIANDSSINQSMGTNITSGEGNVKFEKNKQEVNVNPNKPK
jgi:hypothetical protein